MKRVTALLLVAGLGAASLPAAAMDIAQGARFGAALGRYSNDLKLEGFDALGNRDPNSTEITNVKFTYGGELGYTLTLGDFYGDVGLNLLKVKLQNVDNWRTDLLLTAGYYINDKWSVFSGFRRGWQGDGVFKDDKFEESGPYIGFGFGGLQLGQSLVFNSSFAYNFDRVRDIAGTGIDFSYPGISAKFGMNLKGTPHSLQLRLQHFWGDKSQTFDDGTRLDLDLTETWAVLSYVFSLAW